MTTYEVLERIGLPVLEEREVHPGIKVPVPTGETILKEVGSTISSAELKTAGQTAEDIASLVKSKAMKEKS